MEKPSLEKYGLTQKDIDNYPKQKKLFDIEYKKHLETNKKISFFLGVILTILSFILIINIPSANDLADRIGYAFLLNILLIFPIILLISYIVYLRLDKEKEIKERYINSGTEEKYIKYTDALKEYYHYLEQNDRNYWIRMTGFQFEKEVASLFRNIGYDATVTSATADGGIDIILTKGSERIAVQCKHHSKPVGPNDVRALQGVVASRNYSKGIFVSLNGYTSTVYQEIRSGKVKIELLELTDILQMAKGNHKKSLEKIEIPPKKDELERNPHLGDIVSHKTFGDGIIIKIAPKENNEKYLTVDFAHSVKKFVFPNAFMDDYLTFQKDVNKWVFGEYSFNNYWIFARREYQKVLITFPNDNEDYSHLIAGLKQIMRIEGVDFKGLVISYEKIRPNYYNGGKHYDRFKEYSLISAVSTFQQYLEEVRIKRLSIDGFKAFLVKEANDNEIYLSNKCDDNESIISALINGKKPIEKLKSEHTELYIKKLQNILTKEKIDICLLDYADKNKFIEKYPDYNEPTTEMVLEWLTRYYKKTITTV